MNILLDTCCLLWLANEDAQLSEKASKAIDEAHFTFVSPVSAWDLKAMAAGLAIHLSILLGQDLLVCRMACIRLFG